MVLPPEVSESVEGESFESEDILAGPYGGELHGDVAAVLADGLVERFEVQCVLKTLVVHEVVHAEEPCRVDGVACGDSAIVFCVQAPSLQGGVLPEVQATGNLKVGASRSEVGSRHMLVIVEIMVDEEIVCPPFVRLEHFQGERDKLAVGTEVIEQLCVGLGFAEDASHECYQAEGDFFHNPFFLINGVKV